MSAPQAPTPISNKAEAAPIPAAPSKVTIKRKKKGLSLDDVKAQVKAKQAQETQNEEEEQRVLRQDIDFNNDDVQKAWAAFAEQVKADNKVGLINLLDHCTVKGGKKRIVISTISTTQEELLREHESYILSCILPPLKHAKFQLHIEAQPDEVPASKIPYTAKERWDKLLEDHPELKQFQQDLGLDLQA